MECGQWSKWSNCSEKCIQGIQTRNRMCNNPTTTFGGRPCPGIGSNTTICSPSEYVISK